MPTNKSWRLNEYTPPDYLIRNSFHTLFTLPKSPDSKLPARARTHTQARAHIRTYTHTHVSTLTRFEFCVTVVIEAWGNAFSYRPETLINYLAVKSYMRATF
jgi:hypothetical protein